MRSEGKTAGSGPAPMHKQGAPELDVGKARSAREERWTPETAREEVDETTNKRAGEGVVSGRREPREEVQEVLTVPVQTAIASFQEELLSHMERMGDQGVSRGSSKDAEEGAVETGAGIDGRLTRVQEEANGLIFGSFGLGGGPSMPKQEPSQPPYVAPKSTFDQALYILEPAGHACEMGE